MKHALAVLGLAALLAAPAAASASALDHDRRDRHQSYVPAPVYGGHGSAYAGVTVSETRHQSYVRTGDAAHGYGGSYAAGHYGPYYPYGPHGPVVTYHRQESYGYGYGYHGSAYQARSWGGYGYGYYDPYRAYGQDHRRESRYGHGYGQPRPRPGYRDEWGYDDDRHPYRWDRGDRRHYDRECGCEVYLRDD